MQIHATQYVYFLDLYETRSYEIRKHLSTSDSKMYKTLNLNISCNIINLNTVYFYVAE